MHTSTCRLIAGTTFITLKKKIVVLIFSSNLSLSFPPLSVKSAGVLVRSKHTGEVLQERSNSIASAAASITPTSPSEC